MFSVGAVVTLFLALSVQKIWNVDIWWQLRTGQWVLQHRAFPRLDEFSYTVRDHPWIELRWVFCVLAYLGWEVGGATLLILAQTVMIATSFSIVIRSTRPAVFTVPGVLALALGVCAGASRYVVRPEIITYLIVALFLTMLHATAQGRMKRAWWVLPCLQVVWVNAHTLFVMGPVIAWTFALGTSVQHWLSRSLGWPAPRLDSNDAPDKSQAWLWLTAVLVTAACLANPYGVSGALFPITLWREIHKGSFLGTLIEEFRSPLTSGHVTPDIYLAGVLALFAGLTFIPLWRRVDLVRLALWAGHVYLACIAVRNVGLLAIVGTWLALSNIHDICVDRINRPSTTTLGTPMAAASHLVIGLLCLAGAWYVATDRFASRYGVQEFGLGIVNGTRPAAATAFLLAHPEIKPNIHHNMGEGSYLAWAAHQKFPVRVDPRLEVYGDESLRRLLDMTPEEFQRSQQEFGINVVMLNSRRDGAIGGWLNASPNWALVYLDERNVIFVRDIPEHAGLIKQFRIDPAKPWATDLNAPNESPSALRRALGGVNRPWYSLGMARAFLMLGSLDNAERFLRRALSACPQDGETRLSLAQFERSRGNEENAASLVKGLNLTESDRAWADQMLLQICQFQGNIAMLERMMRASPRDAQIFIALTNGYLAAGDYAKAAKGFEQLCRHQPQRIDFWLNLGACAMHLGDRAMAIDAFRHALEIDPANLAIKAQLDQAAALNEKPASAPTAGPSLAPTQR